MLKTKSLIPVFALSLAAAPLQAAETTGSVELGYLATSGNSETTSGNTQLELGYETGPWNYIFRAGATGASEDGETTQERYTALGKTEYDLTEYDYVFGAVDWTKDLFGGIRERTSVTAGYGRRLIDMPNQSLDVEIGAGYRWIQEQKPSLERKSDPIVRGGLDYLYEFNGTSAFEQLLTVESGADNTSLESVSALKFTLIENLFAKLSYTVVHNTEVPPGLEKTDTYTAISVAYEFGGDEEH